MTQKGINILMQNYDDYCYNNNNKKRKKREAKSNYEKLNLSSVLVNLHSALLPCLYFTVLFAVSFRNSYTSFFFCLNAFIHAHLFLGESVAEEEEEEEEGEEEEDKVLKPTNCC